MIHILHTDTSNVLFLCFFLGCCGLFTKATANKTLGKKQHFSSQKPKVAWNNDGLLNSPNIRIVGAWGRKNSIIKVLKSQIVWRCGAVRCGINGLWTIKLSVGRTTKNSITIWAKEKKREKNGILWPVTQSVRREIESECYESKLFEIFH